MLRKGASINNAFGQLTRKSNRVVLNNLALRPLSYTTCKKMISSNQTTSTPHSVEKTFKQTVGHSNHNNKQQNPQHILDTLIRYHAKGNVKGAVNLVYKAQETNVATPAMYQQLLETLVASPLDIDNSAFVASWFYSPKSTLPADIKNDLQIWHSVMKLGFYLAPTYRKEDLRCLVSAFTTTFDLATLEDQESWALLIRAYGMLDKQDSINEIMARLATEPQYAGFDRSMLEESAVLAYASTRSHEKVNELVESLKQNGKLNEKLLKKLVRSYGFSGDLERTQHYAQLCQQLYPESDENTTMQLIAHRAALSNEYYTLVKERGTQGLPLKPKASTTLDSLHASWNALISGNQCKLDVTQCNVMLEYLTLANRIDPKNFPISKAQHIVDEYMPAHNITPNKVTWMTLLNGYATTCEFPGPTKENLRLDKALLVLSRMDEAGFHADADCFHALFKACIPHIPGKGYLFEHFSLASKLTSALHFRPPLDKRIFELEQIMLVAKIPHDRTTIKLMLTSLGASGKYSAMWRRWQLLKLSGVRRDMGLYQHVFSLASLDPEQSQYALSVTRNELNREKWKHVAFNTHVAMLDCAITAQMPDLATAIIDDMQRQESVNDEYRSISPADRYIPLLRAYTTIPALANKVPALLKELESKQIVYNNPIWQILMSHHLMNDQGGGMQNVQKLFNEFTMQRLEQQGKIPIPVRQSSPIIPFPSGPYSAADISMINMYVAALIDAQDVSLVFDVLRVFQKETNVIGLSRETLRGVAKLAKQEKSATELSWLVHHVLPRTSPQNAEYKKWVQYMQSSVPE